MSATYGLTPTQWTSAREEVRSMLVETAKHEGLISYGALVARLQSVRLEPNSYALAHLLGEISQAEDGAGRGMLTAVVVRQEDQMPGGGFFELALQLGRNTSDRDRCWLDELKRVYATWGRPAAGANP